MSCSPIPGDAIDVNSSDVRKLGTNEFLALFGCPSDQSRWMASADSEEFLALVAYLVGRTPKTFS
jgi:hypothetical protein